MDSDVVIIGAGPVGIACAISLANLGLNVIIIDKQGKSQLEHPIYDGREIALTHSSENILKSLGVWQLFPKDQINIIKGAEIINSYSPYTLNFNCSEVHHDKLGYFVSNSVIKKALYDRACLDNNIQFLCNADINKININDQNVEINVNSAKINTSLLIASDGRFSEYRKQFGITTKMNDCARIAILTKMEHELPHNNIAYECFFDDKTIAVLPVSGNCSSIVITVNKNKAQSFLEQDIESFNIMVTNDLSRRFGKMNQLSERFSYPLVTTYANSFVSQRLALIGDAAVGMHPVTAQGFNLGLISLNILSKQIAKQLAKKQDIAAMKALNKYNQLYKYKSKWLYLATNMIVQLYTNNSFPAQFMRQAILRLGNHISPVKKIIMHQLTRL